MVLIDVHGLSSRDMSVCFRQLRSNEIGLSTWVELFYVAVHTPTVFVVTANLALTLTFSPDTRNRDSAYC
jgi:hypothetical protein